MAGRTEKNTPSRRTGEAQPHNRGREQTGAAMEPVLESARYSHAIAENKTAPPTSHNDEPTVGSNIKVDTNVVAEGRPSSHTGSSAIEDSNSEHHPDGHENQWLPSVKSVKGLLGWHGSRPGPKDSHNKRKVLQRNSREKEREEDLNESSGNEHTKDLERMRKIRRLEKKNLELRTENERINDEFKTISEENRKLKNENFRIKNEKDSETKLKSKLQKDKEKVEKQIKQNEEDYGRKLNEEKARWDVQKTRLEGEIGNLSFHLQESKTTYNTLRASHDVAMKNSQREILDRNNKINILRTDNQSLRMYIDSMRNAQEPIRGEEKYTQAFEDLNNKITSWVLTQSKKNATATLQDAKIRTAILTKIKSFGNYGIHTATNIEPKLQQLYTSIKTRAPLIRHILALFLFDRIFYPFAFGLKYPDPSHDASNYLKFIEDDLFNQGHDFSKLLMIRQAIARGALKSCEKNVSNRREECIKELVDLLSQLLSKSRVQDIKPKAIKFVDSAIQLKNRMTEEQAIYRCFLLFYGETVMNAQVDFDDEETSTRTMLFCTFPGLHRFVLNDDKKMEILIVVKADGILNGDDVPAEMKEGIDETERPSENVNDTTKAGRPEERVSNDNMTGESECSQ